MVARTTDPPDGTEEAPLLTSIEDGVLLARLNRPQAMNALNGHAVELLLDTVAEANESDEVHALVITGEGRGFCAGADLGDLAAHEGGDAPRHHRMDRRGLSGELAETLARCDVPIVAAVNGAAVGAGFGLALCCDVRFLGESARMGSVFIQRGLAADYGAAYWLPRIVGHARAVELLYSGDLVDAARCLELGLATEVLPDDELLERALGYAREIAAGPPLAYTGVRRLLMRASELPMSHFLEYEWTTQLGLLGSEDAQEGFRSFLERRDPHFEGR